MIVKTCRNNTVWRCSKCGKDLWQYTVLGGYRILNDYVQVEFGSPETDQDDTRFYCPKCWEKEKKIRDKLGIKYRVEKMCLQEEV